MGFKQQVMDRHAEVASEWSEFVQKLDEFGAETLASTVLSKLDSHRQSGT